jgi:hypothetical protein
MKFCQWLAGIEIFLMAVVIFITTKLAYMNSDNAFYALAGQSMARGNVVMVYWAWAKITHLFPYIVIEALW